MVNWINNLVWSKVAVTSKVKTKWAPRVLLSRPPQVRSKTINEVRGYANPTAKSGEYTGAAVLY